MMSSLEETPDLPLAIDAETADEIRARFDAARTGARLPPRRGVGFGGSGGGSCAGGVGLDGSSDAPATTVGFPTVVAGCDEIRARFDAARHYRVGPATPDNPDYAGKHWRRWSAAARSRPHTST